MAISHKRCLRERGWTRPFTARSVSELLDRTGIARRDDPGGCRWVAVRHADDHIHIAAVLETGADMKIKYKETSRGGPAVNVIEC